MPESNATDRLPTSERLDAQLSALASTECRYVLYYFQRTSDDVAAMTDLTEFVATNVGATGPEARERVAARLHHWALPRLADAGALEYDVRERVVRYCASADFEKFAAVAAAEELEAA